MQRNHIYLYSITTLLIFSFFSFSIAADYNKTPIVSRSASVYIPSSTTDKVIESLERGGLELNSIDYFILHHVQLPNEGWYSLDNSLDGRFDFFENLHKHKSDIMSIIVFAGDTIEEICQRLAKDMNLDQEKLLSYYKKYSRFKEAEILSGRYNLAKDADEEVVIRYLLSQSREQIDFFAREQFGAKYTVQELREVLIKASIIHKESNGLKEMSYISSVIHNRLKKGMRLQMDGTLNYGKYSHVVVTPERIREDTSRFNTYKSKGLPPYPLCAVSMDALEAAAFPRESDYLYFMLNKKGKHDFTSTYEEHKKKIQIFKDRDKNGTQSIANENIKVDVDQVVIGGKNSIKPLKGLDLRLDNTIVMD